MKVFEKEIVVKQSDIDFNSHVNNLKYLEWMINSAMEHSVINGYGVEYYKSHGVSWVAKSHYIEYKLPAFKDDKLLLKTWIDEIKKVSVIRKYEIYKDDKLITHGWSEWVFVDMQSKRPKRILSEISEKFIISRN